MVLHAQAQSPPIKQPALEPPPPWRAIFTASPAGICLLSAHGQLLESNPAGLALLEADSHAQAQGYCVYALVVESYRQSLQDLVARVFQGASE